jgi:hypothetical protein
MLAAQQRMGRRAALPVAIDTRLDAFFELSVAVRAASSGSRSFPFDSWFERNGPKRERK